MDKKMDKKEKLSFLKRQFRYLQIKQQQKLLEKKIEEKKAAVKNKLKVFTLNHTGTLRKAFIGMALLSGFTFASKINASNLKESGTNAKSNPAFVQRRLPHEIKISGNTYFSGSKDYMPLAQLESIKSGGYYNGVYIDFNTARPEDVVHTFESGNNPTILNYGATSIKNAQYLGEYQFNLNNTIYELVKYCRKDFPELAKAAGVDPESGKIVARKAKTDYFYQVYCDLCEGEQAEKFSRLKFGFMFETHYKPVFQKLHKTFADFPEISPENYANPENFLLSAQVMSTSTQSPGKAFNIIKQQIMNAKLEALKNNKSSVSPLDVYKRVSDFKAKHWGYKLRYQKENGLAQDISTYFNAQAEILARKTDMSNEIVAKTPVGVLLADNTTVNKLNSDAEHKISADLYAMVKKPQAKSGKEKSIRQTAAKLFEAFFAKKQDEQVTIPVDEKLLAQANANISSFKEDKVASLEAKKDSVTKPKVMANTPSSNNEKQIAQQPQEFHMEEPMEKKRIEIDTRKVQMSSKAKVQESGKPVIVKGKSKANAEPKSVKANKVKEQNQQLETIDVSSDKVLSAKDTPNKNGTVKKIRLSNNKKVKLKIAQKKSDFRQKQAANNLYLAANSKRSER